MLALARPKRFKYILFFVVHCVVENEETLKKVFIADSLKTMFQM